MLQTTLYVLIAVGCGVSYLAFVAKRAAVYTSLASLGVWLVVGYGATAIDTVGNDGTINEAAAAEPAIAALAFGNALLSGIVLLAAATGAYDAGTTEPTDPREIAP